MRSLRTVAQMGCWMDTFTETYLGGHLRRHFGPMRLKHFDPASVIVGPDTQVEVTGRVRDQEIILVLRPLSIHADLKSLIPGFHFTSAQIFRQRKPARHPRRVVRELQLA